MRSNEAFAANIIAMSYISVAKKLPPLSVLAYLPQMRSYHDGPTPISLQAKGSSSISHRTTVILDAMMQEANLASAARAGRMKDSHSEIIHHFNPRRTCP